MGVHDPVGDEGVLPPGGVDDLPAAQDAPLWLQAEARSHDGSGGPKIRLQS